VLSRDTHRRGITLERHAPPLLRNDQEAKRDAIARPSLMNLKQPSREAETQPCAGDYPALEKAITFTAERSAATKVAGRSG
jgi:hypothetical protein